MDNKGYSSVGLLIGSQVIARMGLDPARELAFFGLTPEGLASSLVGLPPLLEEQWHRRLAVKLRDPAFAVHCGAGMQLGDMGPYGFYISTHATLREALNAACLASAGINESQSRLVVSGGWARLEWIPVSSLVHTATMGEMRVRCATSLVRAIAEDGLPLAEVWQSHEAPAHAAEIERSHGAPVHFGKPADAIVFDARLLDRPLKHAHAQMTRILAGVMQSLAQPPPGFGFRGAVRHALSVPGVLPAPTLTAAARMFRMPPHVLQYELAKEGTTFRQVLDGFRRELTLLRLIQTPGMTVERMAETLGFQAPRHFYRRFKAWTGTSVSAYRERLQGPAPAGTP